MTDPCQAFLDSLERPAPPPEVVGLLLAVWHGLRGAWEAAHNIAQDDDSAQGAWVHAWLHRIEGDRGNAAYWYRRAGEPRAEGSVKAEGERIVNRLLGG